MMDNDACWFPARKEMETTQASWLPSKKKNIRV